MIKTLHELLKDKVPIAVLGKTHGLNGELRLFPLTNMPEVIESLEEVFIYNEKVKKLLIGRIIHMSLANGYYIVKFRGIDTLNDAKKFVGSTLYIEKSRLPILSSDEYYFYEVIGMKVYDEKGIFLGNIDEVIQTGSNDVFVINKDTKDEILIPVIKEYVLQIDKKSNKIVVKLPEWLD
ncbi:ribosome maturation factor RimM [Thermosipho melanesiensis]|uniref:Ribosome maturation factor RimM n=2 Tax=Thermosipho melanesiensis TaxID=46541 RepID=RIMM_THEM4|nr:ribosome maturation factor RimM [Thermosipho melanesiensis]A6LNY7.1 RecName: Full=Ribosome maturation factor RimM [Thermosipho melanesiensis BI429]ABR31638.1 16S rRNA processing protein RimM [Thermosipho melanesiensis BI429]APT74667.1 ribosome maturation factor RimM [Thermosipho melanesiensis]OOC35166.1 ribosome maturation factor RimM [Thermosipho melanesiensis]OOC35376.1 ribosome maturation factor RimM [Thermosipho melanesiensis]OOC36627.1 ribosome maturation factor RimM [Thermosipho mela